MIFTRFISNVTLHENFGAMFLLAKKLQPYASAETIHLLGTKCFYPDLNLNKENNANFYFPIHNNNLKHNATESSYGQPTLFIVPSAEQGSSSTVQSFFRNITHMIQIYNNNNNNNNNNLLFIHTLYNFTNQHYFRLFVENIFIIIDIVKIWD